MSEDIKGWETAVSNKQGLFHGMRHGKMIDHVTQGKVFVDVIDRLNNDICIQTGLKIKRSIQMEHVEAFSILDGDAVSISIFGVSRDIDIGPIDSKKAVPLQGAVRRQRVGKVVEKFFKSLYMCIGD